MFQANLLPRLNGNRAAVLEREKRTWFQVCGQRYWADFYRRPFREGLEVRVGRGDRELLRLAELGLGERELVARAKKALKDKP